MANPRPGRRGNQQQREAAPREPREGYTAVGFVIKPHGVRGEARVRAFSPEAPHLQRGKWVWLAGERRRVRTSRWDRDAWLVSLSGLESREQVDALRGELLEVPDGEVERADEESYFLHELIGLRVMTKDGRELGTLTEVLQPGANDVYVVKGPAGEVLLPAIGDVVKAIDLESRTMTVEWAEEAKPPAAE